MRRIERSNRDTGKMCLRGLLSLFLIATGMAGTGCGSSNGSSNASQPPSTVPVPGVPSLTLASTSTSQITLTLAEGSPAGSTYTLFRSTATGFTPGAGNQIASGVTGTTYNDTGLNAGTRYYYRAESVSTGGTSALTPEANTTTNTQLNAGVAILMEAADYTNSGACPAKTPIMSAVCDLQRDLKNVFGQTSQVYVSETSALQGVPLIVVTRPGGSLTGYIDTSLPANSEEHELTLMQGAVVGTSPQRMVLQGGSTRGTLYAIYQFSDEFLGVPPLYYWTGWLQSHTTLSNVQITHNYQETILPPSVKYRGIYPGDTDLLDPWLNSSTTNYAAYFETYLRLKLNTMDVGSISDVPSSATGKASPNTALQYAQTCAQRGLIVTFTHTSPFGADFSDWQNYWTWQSGGNNTTIGNSAPAITDTANMTKFWGYYLGLPAKYNIPEVLQTLAFRGLNDEPWWLYVTGDPNPGTFSQYEATQIANQLTTQLGMLQAANGTNAPARIIFYDEVQDFLADRVSLGYTFNVPDSRSDSNLIWSFANTQRDGNPGKDVQAYTSVNFPLNYATQLTGYYENPEFSNTGAHISSAEGPWKLEANQRFVMNQSAANKYSISILNVGNFREFTVETSAAAALLWSPINYGNTTTYLNSFATKYFGATQASTIVGLFQQYYNSFWQTAANDFTAGGYSPTGTPFPNEYPFQDGRYAQASLVLMDNIGAKCSAAASGGCANQFAIHSGTGGRYNDGSDYYNIIAAATNSSSNETAAMIYGTNQAMTAFASVATNCANLKNATGLTNWPYLVDSLCSPASTMRDINIYENGLAMASTLDTGAVGPVNTALTNAQTGLHAWLTDLGTRQGAPIFPDWYDLSSMTDFPYTDMDTKLTTLLQQFP